MAADARLLAGAALADALRDARATTLARTMDQDDDAWNVAQQSGVNLPAWELGHLAWFAEFWILRGPHRAGADGLVTAAKPPSIAGPDAIFDSARLAHGDRWRVALPSRDALATRLADQLDACIDAIPRDADDDDANYFHRLALFHEDMHGEAFAWLRATLGWPAPAGLALPSLPTREPLRIDGGSGRPRPRARRAGLRFRQRAAGDAGRLAPFEIDATPLRNAEFVAFVEAGGYDDATLWPGQAGAWRARHASSHPSRWRRDAVGAWQMRWFDRWLPLDAAAPVIHVSAWEAEAYCRWAGRRLPHAAEWERAARTRASAGAAASGNGPPTRSCPTRASSPDPTPTTRSRGSAIIASCAAAPSPPPSDCTTRAIATSSSPTATTSSRAFAPPPFNAETKALP